MILRPAWSIQGYDGRHCFFLKKQTDNNKKLEHKLVISQSVVIEAWLYESDGGSLGPEPPT